MFFPFTVGGLRLGKSRQCHSPTTWKVVKRLRPRRKSHFFFLVFVWNSLFLFPFSYKERRKNSVCEVLKRIHRIYNRVSLYRRQMDRIYRQCRWNCINKSVLPLSLIFENRLKMFVWECSNADRIWRGDDDRNNFSLRAPKPCGLWPIIQLAHTHSIPIVSLLGNGLNSTNTYLLLIWCAHSVTL